ncbi:MAG: class I SAM-dependent methyltransferase [Acidobacteriaceae bacterium]
MPLSVKSQLKILRNRIFRNIFEVGQHFRVDILPRHFYSEIPDLRLLKNTTHWKAPRSFFGIRSNIDDQVAWVDQCTRDFRSDLKDFRIHTSAIKMNGSSEGFGAVEADFLYCFIRANRPNQIVQIGCGVSTAVCLLAAQDARYHPQITCIEPYPSNFLRQEAQAGRIQLVPGKLQEVGHEYASNLKSGDLFFVDSSHTLAPAGEVNIIILEMLPRLAPGTYAHFHDIHFPYDYSTDTLSTALFFSHETALLYAFLTMNDRFEIAASLAMLHHQRINELVRFFPDMKPRIFDEGLTTHSGHYPSSIYLRRRQDQDTNGHAE